MQAYCWNLNLCERRHTCSKTDQPIVWNRVRNKYDTTIGFFLLARCSDSILAGNLLYNLSRIEHERFRSRLFTSYELPLAAAWWRHEAPLSWRIRKSSKENFIENKIKCHTLSKPAERKVKKRKSIKNLENEIWIYTYRKFNLFRR